MLAPVSITDKGTLGENYIYTVNVKGGLGNQLFQVAASWGIAKSMNSKYCIYQAVPSKHSRIDYFDTLLSAWKPYRVNHIPRGSVVLDSYFQDYRYIEPIYNEFVNQLDFTGYDSISKYDEIDTSAFVHIRGGDYLQLGYRDLHFVDLTDYYRRAIVNVNSHLYAFTNDKEYYDSLSCFDDVRITPVNTNEVSTLFLMSQCGRGGIAANSTLSWWGLYLDRSRPNLFLPDTWFNDDSKNTVGYYFPEAAMLPV